MSLSSAATKIGNKADFKTNTPMANLSRPNSEMRGKIAIAAIDFGTTCTGYAYHLRKDHGSHLQDINIDQAWVGSAELGLQAPTTVLMDPDKRFHSFGFEAEAKYKTLTLKNDHHDWYYFRYFKMSLHHAKDLNRDMLLADADGKTMKALVIFSDAIKYVKKHLLMKLKDALKDQIRLRDIKWVITVPAIWRDSAKQFMREAASRAGIPTDQLTLALEPESAAIFCKELALNRAEGVEGVFLRAFDPGEKYIVVDLGGGTVDTTGHEVLEDGTLRELHAAAGGPWGGQLVNDAFEKFIEKMVTWEVFKRFCKDCTSDWIEFQRDFEKKKRQFSQGIDEIDLNFPVDLEIMYKDVTKEELKTRLADKDYRKGVELVKHSMILKSAVMLKFFDHATEELTKHIAALLKKKELKEISTILLVGGFAESPIVSSAVRNKFTSLRVLAPGAASVAILKGAVMFGNNSRVIASRVSPYSYGVHTRRYFNKEKHPQHRVKMVRGKKVVDNAFDKHIEIGENVYVGGQTRERTYVISNRRNPSVFWKVFQSDEQEPVFCDEPGCRYLGKLGIDIPEDVEQDRVSLQISMTCRGTELEATAHLVENGNKCVAAFDFMARDFTMGHDDDDDIVSVME